MSLKSRVYSFRLSPRHKQEAQAIAILDARLSQVNNETGDYFGVREVLTDALIRSADLPVQAYAPRVGMLTADAVEAIVNHALQNALEAQHNALIDAINDSLADMQKQGYSVRTSNNEEIQDDDFASAFASQVVKRMKS